MNITIDAMTLDGARLFRQYKQVCRLDFLYMFLLHSVVLEIKEIRTRKEINKILEMLRILLRTKFAQRKNKNHIRISEGTKVTVNLIASGNVLNFEFDKISDISEVTGVNAEAIDIKIDKIMTVEEVDGLIEMFDRVLLPSLVMLFSKD